MAWSAPPTWSVSQVVTAAQMTILSDDLNYLKGNAGAVAIGSTITVAGTVVATAGGSSSDILSALSGNTGNYGGLGIGRAISEARFFVPSSAGQFLASAAAGDAGFRVDDSAKKILLGAGATETMVVTSSGVGIGAAAPAGKLHVGAAGAVTTGGFVVSSVAAVTSIQTIFAAGTVSRGAMIILLDRNNTGGGLNSAATISAIAAVGGSFTYTNNDTITIAVTAGGAVTAQRTVGTNGTHDIVALAIFL